MRSSISLVALASSLAALSSTSTVHAQSMDSVPIWSLVLEFHTCNVSNAGTDDAVSIVLGGTEIELNLGHDDRNRDDVDAYELVGFLPAGATGAMLADAPVITKRGSDQWCFDEVRLYVNQFHGPLYELVGQRKIDQASGMSPSFTLPSLRTGGGQAFSAWNDAGWISTVTQAPNLLDDNFFWVLFDTLQGHLNRFEPTGRDDFTWGNLDSTTYVAVDSNGARTYMVDYDLRFRVPNRAIEWRETDADANFTFTCVNGEFRFTQTSTCDVNDGVIDQADSNCRSRFGMMAETQRAHLERALLGVRALGKQCVAGSRFNMQGDLQLP